MTDFKADGHFAGVIYQVVSIDQLRRDLTGAADSARQHRSAGVNHPPERGQPLRQVGSNRLHCR